MDTAVVTRWLYGGYRPRWPGRCTAGPAGLKGDMRTVWVWGRTPPATSIACCEPQWAEDSGLSVLYVDAPDPEDVAGPGHPGIALMHVGCLLAGDPELSRGFAVAREYGLADWDEIDGWIVGDLTRLERDLAADLRAEGHERKRRPGGLLSRARWWGLD